jgi:hypothetical protein
MQSAILPEPKHNGLHLPHKGDTTRWSGPTRWRLRYSRTQLSALLSSAPPRQLMSHSASRKTSLCGAHIIIDRLYMCLMQNSISNLALATSAQHSKKNLPMCCFAWQLHSKANLIAHANKTLKYNHHTKKHTQLYRSWSRNNCK